MKKGILFIDLATCHLPQFLVLKNSNENDAFFVEVKENLFTTIIQHTSLSSIFYCPYQHKVESTREETSNMAICIFSRSLLPYHQC